MLVAEPDMEWVFMDGRYAKAHQHSAGAASESDEAIGRSRAGNTSKIHLAVDAHGLPIEFEITGGQINDCTQAPALITKLPAAETIVADKGYDSERIREQIERPGAEAVIPSKRSSIIRQRGSGQRSVPKSPSGGKRLRPAEALPGGGLSIRQAQEKLRERGGHGLCPPVVAHVKRQQALVHAPENCAHGALPQIDRDWIVFRNPIHKKGRHKSERVKTP